MELEPHGSGARSRRSATRSRPGRTVRRARREVGVPRALVDAVAMNPREAERKQIAQLLVAVGHARC